MARRAALKPRPVWWPEVDRLLTAGEAAALVGIKPGRWSWHADQFDVLCRGRRWVKSRPEVKNPVPRWLLSAVLRHIHEELAGVSS